MRQLNTWTDVFLCGYLLVTPFTISHVEHFAEWPAATKNRPKAVGTKRLLST